MIINRLPQILAEQSLSIRELARRTGVTYSTIWAVVHGERRSVQLEVLEVICLVLTIQPGDIYVIVSGDGLPVPKTTLALSFEEKKGKLDRQDLTDRGAQIQAGQKQRPGEPVNDWRSW
jgi:DNA-binding Xre family transcriptional regulator